MNLVGYLRVSTDRQADEGMGLDVQRDTIAAWAAARGDTVVYVADEGVSGSNGIETRLALAEALDLLGRGADGIVVARLDRLARDLIVQEQLLDDVRRRGGKVYSCSGGEAGYLEDDPADPSRRMIRQVLGAVAEYERAMIRLRMQAGRARKAAAGGYANGGPPYGWAAVGGDLVPVPAEQAQIEIAVALQDSGVSLRTIAGVLNDSGVPPRRGERWSHGTIGKILKRENHQSQSV